MFCGGLMPVVSIGKRRTAKRRDARDEYSFRIGIYILVYIFWDEVCIAHGPQLANVSEDRQQLQFQLQLHIEGIFRLPSVNKCYYCVISQLPKLSIAFILVEVSQLTDVS